MRQLHGDGNTDTELLRELFLQRLPKEIRVVLTALATDITKTLDDLADTVDNMIEATGSTTSVDNNSPYQIPGQVTEIELLRQEVAALRHVRYHKRPASTNTKGFCWYHARFGKRERARSCAQPCSFPEMTKWDASDDQHLLLTTILSPPFHRRPGHKAAVPG